MKTIVIKRCLESEDPCVFMWFNQKRKSKFKYPEDLIAGLTSSISTVPDALAAAVIAGVNPINGIYSAFLAPLVASWTTSSIFMRVSTTGALALAANGVVHHVDESEKLSSIVLITFLAGGIQLLFGVLKLGWIVNFVSNSLMRGFLTAISLLIILGQVPEITGNYSVKVQNKVVRAIEIFSSPELFNWYSIAVTGFTIICILAIKQTRARYLSFLIALILGTIMVHAIPDFQVRLVKDENTITSIFPSFALPQFDHLIKLSLSAFSIAIIGYMEGAGVSHLKTNPGGKYPDNSKDLRGQGFANVLCSLFSGIPVGGSMSQTSILIDAGARSRWANFLSGLLLLVFILLLGKVIEELPYACFSAILVVAALESVKKGEIITIGETSWHSLLIMLSAFVITMAFPLYIAVFVCILLTGVLHLIHKSNHVEVKSLQKVKKHYLEVSAPEKLLSDSVQVLIPYGVLIFAGAFEFQNKLPRVGKVRNCTLILALRGRQELGSNFLSVLQRFADKLKKRNNKLLILGVTKNVHHQLRDTNLNKIIGEENIHSLPDKVKGSVKKHCKKEEERTLEQIQRKGEGHGDHEEK